MASALPQPVVEMVARFVDAAELQEQTSRILKAQEKIQHCTWLASMRLTSRLWRDAVDAVVPPPMAQCAALGRLHELIRHFDLEEEALGLYSRMNAVWDPYGGASITASVLEVPPDETTCVRVLEYFSQLGWPQYAVYAILGPTTKIPHFGREESVRLSIEALATRRASMPLANEHHPGRCPEQPCPKDASCPSGLLSVWDAFGHCYGWSDSVESFHNEVILEWAELCERFPVFAFAEFQIVATTSTASRSDKSGGVVSLPLLTCPGDLKATPRSCSVGCLVFEVCTD